MIGQVPALAIASHWRTSFEIALRIAARLACLLSMISSLRAVSVQPADASPSADATARASPCRGCEANDPAGHAPGAVAIPLTLHHGAGCRLWSKE